MNLLRLDRETLDIFRKIKHKLDPIWRKKYLSVAKNGLYMIRYLKNGPNVFFEW